MENKLNHIAIILDGNRRWAKEKGLDVVSGYRSVEAEKFVDFLKLLQERNVEYFSAWAFSTENWKRPEREKKEIFKVIEKAIEYILKLKEKNFVFKWIGRRDRIEYKLKEKIEKLERETKKNAGKITFQLFLDYGGRDEIVRAVNKILKEKKEISEEEFSNYLDTESSPDPDLIIRTGGDLRISGFMPYQSVYSELYFTKKYFPDFSVEDLREAVDEFSRRQRRFGEK